MNNKTFDKLKTLFTFTLTTIAMNRSIAIVGVGNDLTWP